MTDRPRRPSLASAVIYKDMLQLKRWLEETERLWTVQSAAFKSHLERPQ